MGICKTMDYVLAVFLLISLCFVEESLSLVASGKEIKCKDPGLLHNGFREGLNFSYGAEVKYICKKGYVISGSPVRVCTKNGRWTGVEPFCNECAKVGTAVLVRSGNNFLSASILEKRSFAVTVMTNDPMYPEKDVDLAPGGQPYPMVDDRVPKLRDIVNGSRVIAMNSAKGIYMLAFVIGLEKNGSYIFHVTFADNTTAEVSLKQLRTLEKPTFCALCDNPETPENAYIQEELREFISGMGVTYKCKDNFVIDGPNKRKCRPNGQWSGVPPTCKAVACEGLEVIRPSNGQRVGDDFSVGSILTFICDEEYELDGKRTLRCKKNGKWSSAAPTCKHMCENRNITCREWEKCSYVTKDKPGCVCRQNIDCTALYRPLCGSDGNMYNNYCIMKATGCRQTKRIRQLNNSDCKPAGVCQIKPLSPCRGYFRRFWYNSETKQCEKIIAGGCHPSGWNGFYTKLECESTCLVDVCAFPLDRGPCDNYMNRWGFDKKSGKCIQFNYGGCSGNENNFLTEGKCRLKCMEKAKCNVCSRTLLSEACKINKNNTFAFVVKIKRALAPDTRNRLLMYNVQIKKIFFDNTQMLSKYKKKAILSVQYTDPGACHCPKFPLKGTFLVMGHSPDGFKTTAKTGLTVASGSYVHIWNKDLKKQLKRLCNL